MSFRCDSATPCHKANATPALNDEWRQAVADRDAAWDELVAAYGGAKIET